MDELKQTLYARHDFETLIFEGKFRTGAVAHIVQELRADNFDAANEQFDLLRTTGEGEGDIWYHIIAAYTRSKAGRMLEAKQELQNLISYSDIESRLRIWAWQKLREWGVPPSPEVANEVYGVVLEVGVPNGTEIMGAYADGTARYINKTGGMIVWEIPDEVNSLLAKKITGVAQSVLPHLPLANPAISTANGNVQMAALTAGGIRTRTMAMAELRGAGNPLTPLFQASAELLKSLIQTVENSKT